MRVLVCGGRGFEDTKLIHHYLNAMSVTLVIVGGASGVDLIAQRWAEGKGIPCMVFYAQWDYYKKKAGPIRNGWMLEFGEPEMVLAFPGAKGTDDMVRKARKDGVSVKMCGVKTRT